MSPIVLGKMVFTNIAILGIVTFLNVFACYCVLLRVGWLGIRVGRGVMR